MFVIKFFVVPLIFLVIGEAQFSEGVISDHESMSVCPGGQLMLSCHTNSSSLQWTVTAFPPSYLDPRESGVRSFLRTGLEITHEPPIIINQTIFYFSKTSSSPLTSVVSVVNVTTDINQTRIECIHSGGMSETIIHVIGSDAIANPWPVSITAEQFGTNNINVTLKWAKKEIVFSSVIPAADVRLIGNMSVQLIIPYNILHNVSVAVCGQSPTKVAELYYITCDDPVNSLAVINYTPPATEGSSITIECSIDDVRANLTTDNHISTCTNGQWEPSLDQIIEGCEDPGSIPTVAASGHSTLITIVISMAVAIIVFFTFGFVCGYFCHKYKQSILASCTAPIVQSSIDSKVKQAEQDSRDLEMTENVAYGPLRGSQLTTNSY